jgi:hypothetical protein
MNDRITSEQTTRSSHFRRDVMARDGPVCVFTESPADDCDAAHLLPKSKGDEVCIPSSFFRVTTLLNTLLVHCGCSPRSSQFVRRRSRT